jgi:catechol 2,3-dioxygenase-like lactoylglutathione lyase family enzyme
MEINGVAHVMLTVRDVAKSRAFYAPLLEHMGLTKVIDSPEYLYYVGGRTAVGLRPAGPEFTNTPFQQGHAGLHHVCFRARERADVDSVHALVQGLAASHGGKIVHPPREDKWVPGYYSVLFEDPDGIRLEANFVPGRGNLDVIKDKPLTPVRM